MAFLKVLRILGLVGAMAAVALPQSLGPAPTVEAVEFEALSDAEQRSVQAAVSVREKAELTVAARHRMAEELSRAGKAVGRPLTFSYRPGGKSGTVRVKISGGC